MQVCIPRATHASPWGTNDLLTNRIAEPPPITSRSTHLLDYTGMPARAEGVFMQFCKNLNSRS